MSDVLHRVSAANPIFDLDHVDPAEFEMALNEIEDRLEFGHEPPRIPTARHSGWLQPATVAAGAGLFVILAIAAPILLLRSEGQPVADTSLPPVTTTLPITTTAPTPTTLSPTIPTAPLLSWERIEDQDAFTDAAILAVTSGGPGLVAVGEADEDAPSDEYRGNVAVWVSTDGTAWERVDDPSFTGKPDSGCTTLGLYQGVWRVASGPLGIVATGRDACNGAVWVSDDGRAWTEIIDDDWLDNPVAVEGGVTAGGPGWIAVGGDGHGNGAIWVSEDGVDWTGVHDDDLLAADGSQVRLWDVTMGGPGLVAVGFIGFEGTESERSAIWVSTDGFDWERLPDDTIDHGALFRIVRDEKSARLMVISRPTLTTPDWMAWVSSDGINWSPATLPRELNEGVVWKDDRLVAAGLASTDGGATWTDISRNLPGFDGSYIMRDVTGFGDQVVVVGYQPGIISQEGWGEAGGSTAAIWIGTWDE